MEVADWTALESHPACAVFPLLGPEEIKRLAEDIAAHGLISPVVLHQGKILDGRNRLLACEKAGVSPRFIEWDGEGSPTAWVVSTNLHRRHLDESQRAMVGAKLKPLFAEEAKERKRAGKVSLNLGQGRSAEKAAELVNVSRASVEHATKVLDSGAEELIAAVQSGQASVSAAALVAEEPREIQREVVAKGEKEILAKAKEIRSRKLETRRAERMEKLAEISAGNAPLEGVGAYPVIYADPPWKYEHAESANREIENHYPTMELDAICAMDVEKVTTPDAILFLWATSPKLAEAMRVVESWGFTYRTCMVWVKDKIGMGYYARQKHELLLIATKGQIPAPAPSDRPASVIEGERAKHSAKPEIFYELIERMYPGLPRLELFCRSPREGWAVWGNQAA